MRASRPTGLMLRAIGLGDFLTGVPAYRALRAAYPEHETVLAAPAVLAPLAALCDAIDRLLPTGELEPIAWSGPPPDVGADLHGNGPASHGLVAATGASTLMMYASATAPDVKGPWWDDGEHEVGRWCRLLEWWGIATDRTALHLDPPPDPPPVADATIVHPGAASGSRRWPAGRFASVASALAASGHTVVVTGTEQALAQAVAERAGLPDDAVLAGRTGLAELAALVARSRLVISGDTGIAHLAFAYRRPSVTLYGPVSPCLWGPPGTGPHQVLWHGTGDRPGDPHESAPDPRLLDITVADVLASADQAEQADQTDQTDQSDQSEQAERG